MEFKLFNNTSVLFNQHTLCELCKAHELWEKVKSRDFMRELQNYYLNYQKLVVNMMKTSTYYELYALSAFYMGLA